MNLRFLYRTIRALAICELLFLFISGCAPPAEKQWLLCQGAGSVDESIGKLGKSSESMTSFRMNGRCKSRFYEEGKKYEENFGVKLWVQPPEMIRMQGDIFLDPKGIVLGANEEEFWFSIKPELSSYLWGKWSEQDSTSAGLINPATLLETLGRPKIDDEKQWSLAKEGAFDVLTKADNKGRTVKKVYVYCCDYLVRKIEYYGKDDKPALVAELDGYKQLKEDFYVPSSVKMITFDSKGNENFFKMTFETPKLYEFSDKQLRALFSRPEPRGFKSVYRMVDGEAIEQPQQ
jgi:hypothetical protein